jgi:hypothetical protein
VVGVFGVELAAYSRACGLLTSKCSSRLPRCFLLYKSSVQMEVHASALLDMIMRRQTRQPSGAGLEGKMRVALLGHARIGGNGAHENSHGPGSPGSL